MKLPSIKYADSLGSPRMSPGRRSRSPGYTFGGKIKVRDPREACPGPGAYHVAQKPEGPAFSMHAKFSVKPSQTPGPGSYNLSKGRDSSPSFSFGTRLEPPTKPSPGPAEYSPRAVSTTTSFTMGKKMHKKTPITPGPGSYGASLDVTSSNSHGTVFSKRSTTMVLKPKKLEPIHLYPLQHGHQHQYSAESPKPSDSKVQEPNVAGRSSGMSQFAGWSNAGKDSPSLELLLWTSTKMEGMTIGRPAALRGGGTASSPPSISGSTVQTSRVSSPSSDPDSIRAPDFDQALPRETDFAASKTPGPGWYDPKPTGPSEISCSFGPKLGQRDSATTVTPGPGYYKTENSVATGPAFTIFGKRPKRKAVSSSVPHSGPTSFRSSTGYTTTGPAYTLAGIVNRPAREQVPGPGAYDVKSVSSSVSYTMGDRSPVPNRLQGLPGPGTYHQEFIGAKTDGPAYTINGRVAPVPTTAQSSPGPGTYKLTTSKPVSPAFSFGKKTQAALKPEKTPGPGHYDTLSSVTTSRLSSPVGSRRQETRTADTTPGPGAYFVHVKASSPSYTIGAKVEDPSRPMQPGPGHYKVKSAPDGPHYSITRKCNYPSGMPTPGPGTYAATRGSHQKLPAYTMGGRVVSAFELDMPGPGDYDSQSCSRGPAASLRARYDLPEPAVNANPGPGTYVPCLPPDSPAITIAGRPVEGPPQFLTPGPGAYKTEHKRQGPAYSLTSRHEGAPVGNADNPGPGQYNVKNGSIGRDLAGFTMQGRPKTPLPNKTPGPGAYPLPEQVGVAYTLGARVRSPEPDKSPGPGAYETSSSRTGSPSHVIGRKVAERTPDETPGPGAYFAFSTGTNGPHYTMFPRVDPLPRDPVPGPGEYKIDCGMRLCSPASPSYSLGWSSPAPPLEDFPGPGQYSPNPDVVYQSSRTVLISHTGKPVLVPSENPGPGHYNPHPVERSPAFTLAAKVPAKEAEDPTPGPGAYRLRGEPDGPSYSMGVRIERPTSLVTPGPGTHYRPATPEGPKYTFSIRPPNLLVEETPGPGEYMESAVTRSEAPAFRFGARYGEARLEESPGPGAYSPSLERDSPAFSLAANVGSRCVVYDEYPGPGEYPIESETSGPAYTMRSRVTETSREDFPGPGQYNPKDYYVRSPSSPACSLGMRYREPLVEKTPGPGSYSAVSSLDGPAFTMSFRGPQVEEVGTPGPGTYTPQSRASTPSFTMCGRAKQREPDQVQFPAPGQYDVRDESGGPHFTIRERFQLVPLDDVPGPGAYM